jgi:hypothetical protein
MVKERGGICIHLKRIGPDFKVVDYANEEEAKNDPIVESRAEEKITWDTFGESSKPYLDIIGPYMDKYFAGTRVI